MPSVIRHLPGSQWIAKGIQEWRIYHNFHGQKFRGVYRQLPAFSTETINGVRNKALRYLEHLRIDGGPYGRYRYSYGTKKPPLLYASVFAALLRHLLGDLDQLTSRERGEWTHYIQSYQCEDGLFRDPLVMNEIAETEDWWGWRHLTLHTLMALHALESQSKYRLSFLERVDTPGKVRRWLDTLDWNSRASFTSNAVQNYGAALQYARDFMGEASFNEVIKELLAGIAERCHSDTGLWGNGFRDRRVALSEGVQAGYHFWLLFWYDGQEIPFSERAIESILKLQNRMGGFSLTQLYTTACQDIDGLDPLVRLALRHPGLKAKAYEAVDRGLRWILYNFNDDGGATFQRNKAFIYGHELMSSGPDQSTIFATWFRLLSLGIGCRLLQTMNQDFERLRWEFLSAPGYQFQPLDG